MREFTVREQADLWFDEFDLGQVEQAKVRLGMFANQEERGDLGDGELSFAFLSTSDLDASLISFLLPR